MIETGTILIVDDNPVNLGIIAGYLEVSGLEVLAARSGESGLKRAEYAQPDLILLDIILPGVDGFEVCQRLKQSPITQAIPVIFMTALTETEHKLRGFQAGAVDYITKPLQQEEVLARISTHLQLRKLTLRLEQEVEARTRELREANQLLEQDIIKRQRIETALRIEQQFSEAILNAPVDTVFVFELESGKALRWNTTFAQVSGYSNEEIAQMHMPRDWYSAEDLEKTVVANQELRDVGQTKVELSLITKSGKTIPFEYTATQVVSPEDNQMYVVSIGRDITERQRMERNRLELALERERVQIISDFITQASHEFRTPLSTINTSTYILKKATDPDVQQRHMRQIEEQVQDITALVNDLTTMSRLDSMEELMTYTVNLVEIVHNVYTLKSSTMQTKDIHSSFETPTQTLTVQGNSDYLKQAIERVLNNAIRHTAPGGAIRFRLDVADQTAVLEISDSGAGIPSETLPHIFKRFYRGDKAGTTRGFGLGLPIARSIIERHMGRIEMTSIEGQGSTCRIYLPISQPA